MMWARHVAHMGVRKNAYRVLVGKSERRRSCRSPKHRWEIVGEINPRWGSGA